MNSIFLGIDISKNTFDVALLNDNKIQNKQFNNSQKGFAELKQWLTNKAALSVHACMEATGCYSEELAQYLYDNNLKVSVVNPARIKGFAMSQLSRNKTDKADSGLIAKFCQKMQPDTWEPAPLHVQELQDLVRRLEDLISMKNQETNRLEGASAAVIAEIKKHTKFLDKAIKTKEQLIADHIKSHKDLQEKSKLLETIPGMGEKTIAVVLAFLNDVEKFESAKQVAAFVGLSPQQRSSGSSVRGKTRISKTGDSDLRKAFYMPGVVAMRHNPLVKKLCENLTKAGKCKMVIVIAAMRKLLHIIYGVLKSKTIFNANIDCRLKSKASKNVGLADAKA